MKLKIFFLVLTKLFIYTCIEAQTKYTFIDAVTALGKQKLASQKILNARLFLLYDVQAEKFKKDIESNSFLFQQNLDNLLKLKTEAKIDKELETVEKKWAEYKTQLANLDTSQKKVLELVKCSNSLFYHCDVAMRSLTEFAYRATTENSAQARDWQVISKQLNYIAAVRIASVRFPIYYNLFIGEYEQGLTKSIQNASEIIQTCMGLLANAEINNENINEQVAVAFQQWDAFKAKYFNKGTYRFKDYSHDPFKVFEEMANFQAKLDRITYAYVQLSAEYKRPAN